MTRAIRVNTGNSWAILRDIILRNTASRSESYITPIKGFEFHRQVSNADPKPHFYEPVIIVVVQGKKLVKIGAEEHHYGENICFVAKIPRAKSPRYGMKSISASKLFCSCFSDCLISGTCWCSNALYTLILLFLQLK